MNNWNTDAGNISDESSFDNALLLKTYQIEDFLNTQRDNLFFVKKFLLMIGVIIISQL